MKTEWIDCNVCGADSYTRLSVVDGWPIGQCDSCGLIYVNPVPFFDASSDFSAVSVDFQYTRYMLREITPAILKHERNQLCGHLDKIRALTGTRMSTLTFLDVGCGSGAAVRAADDLGWAAIGIDIDPALIKVGREQLKADLRCTPLLESGLEGGQFDFIRLRDVIEHLPDPYASLVEIRRLLTPGGIALFVTPNEGGLPNQVRLKLTRKRDRVAAVRPPHHLHGFTPQTYQQLFARVGFDILEIVTTTPVDPAYVTSNNMRAASNKLNVALWQAAKVMARGSMLVGWVRKDFAECLE